VAKWRSQFVERRLEGLYDEPRVGAPRTVSDEQVEAIIVKTLETSPLDSVDGSTKLQSNIAAKMTPVTRAAPRQIPIERSAVFEGLKVFRSSLTRSFRW
jgi:transposase